MFLYFVGIANVVMWSYSFAEENTLRKRNLDNFILYIRTKRNFPKTEKHQ